MYVEVLYCFIYVYICVFVHVYFVRNDEIKMFNQSVKMVVCEQVNSLPQLNLLASNLLSAELLQGNIDTCAFCLNAGRRYPSWW